MSSLHRLCLLGACLSLFATGCSAEPDANAAPRLSPLLGAEPAPKWWAADKSHSDSAIIEAQIDWSSCARAVDRGADGQGSPRTLTKTTAAPSARDVRIGAMVHTGAQQKYTLREKFWAKLMDQNAPGREGHPTALYVSVVPYAVWDGKRHWLVPVVEPGAGSNPPAIKTFVPTCTPDVFPAFAAFPSYYSSVQLEIDAQKDGRKARLAQELGHLVGANLQFLPEPLPLPDDQLPSTLRALLRPIFDQKQAVFLQERVSASVTVTPLELTGGYKIAPNPAPRVSILFNLDQPAVRALREALRDEPIVWQLQCDAEGKTRGLAPMADLDQPARFYANCAPSPTGGLEIDNFVGPILAIPGLPVISLDGESLKATLLITNGKAYTPAETALGIKRTNSGKDSTWDIPLRFFERPDGALRWPLQKTGGPDGAQCGPELRATMVDVLAGKRFTVAQACQFTLVEWPGLWSAPLQGCRPNTIEETESKKGLKRKRCQVPRGEEVTLAWPGLLEAITLTAQETNPQPPETPVDITGRLRPRLPFPADDPWLGPAPAGEYEAACGMPPRFRIETVRYRSGSNGNTLDKAGALHGDRLPSFQDVGWPADQPLPLDIKLRLAQKTPTNPVFVDQLRISWDPVTTTEPRPLAEWAGADARQRYPIEVTNPVPGQGNEQLTVHWFADEQSCQAGQPASDQVPLTPEALTGQQRGPCEWARLFAGTDSASSCVRGEENGGHLAYQFPLLSCGHQRNLILIAPSSAFDAGGRDLKDWLITQLESLGASGARVPFDLLTLNPQQGLERLIRCEDLPGATDEGAASPWTAVARLRFGADDLRALENLKAITREPAFQASRLTSILYITDGAGVPEIGRPSAIEAWSQRERQQALERAIPFDQRSHLLEWVTNGVQVRVLSNGPCTAWELLGAVCETLPTERDARLHLIQQRIREALREP